MPLIYLTTSQAHDIRAELDKIYKAKNTPPNKLSYNGLAALIEEYWVDSRSAGDLEYVPAEFHDAEVKLHKTDNFRKFVKKQSDEMEEHKLWACLVWLMSDECEDSNLTRFDIAGYSHNNKIAGLLQQFLYEHTDESPLLNAKLLSGKFSLVSDTRKEFSITFSPGTNPQALAVRAVETGTFEGAGSQNYSGFLVIAPNDSGFILLQNMEQLTNRLLLLMRIESRVADDNLETRELLLLDLGYPINVYEEPTDNVTPDQLKLLRFKKILDSSVEGP